MNKTSAWYREDNTDPPIYRRGVLRFQPHGLVLAACSFVWSSLLVRLTLQEPLSLDYTSALGAGFLVVAVFALLVSLVEVGTWLRALLPSRRGGQPLSVGVVEALCLVGLSLHLMA